MNRTDLMIGNLISHKNQIREVLTIGVSQVIFQLIGATRDVVDNDIEVVSYEECSGIPLTKDWLQALGLKEDSDNSPDYGIWYDFPDERLRIRLDEDGPHRLEFEDIHLTRLSFVHQLQNLYLLITGDNLKATSHPEL
jgi:hypothetical protein